jgi:diguanylate cyclase (GGDEF)-like protein
MSIRLKLTLFLSFLFVSAIGNAVFTFQLESYSEEKLKWVNHTHNVIIKTEKFLSYIQDTETGQRGFLLTRNPAYLEPYIDGRVKSIEYLDELRILTSDNPGQQERLDTIEKYLMLKLNELDETISLAQINDHDKALEIVKQNTGKEHMDNIRNHIKDFISAEMLLLEIRKGDFKADRTRITTLIIIEIISFIFLAILTIVFLNKNLFSPMKLLLSSTHKMEKGEKLNIADILARDEMGYLLTRFIEMNEKVYDRTQKLDYSAHHDKLTGLKNRTSLVNEIENAIKHRKEFNNKCAVLFIDLNKFKQLNDTLGHDAGDTMLKETATRLSNSVRSDDCVFRIGGDEFLVLIKNIEEYSVIGKIVTNILDACKSPVMLQGNRINISLSIGIAISPKDTEDSDEILKFSDIAMYEAKTDKDTNYKYFDRNMLKRTSDV